MEEGRQRPGEVAHFSGFAGTARLPKMAAGLGLGRHSGSQEPESLKYEAVDRVDGALRLPSVPTCLPLG